MLAGLLWTALGLVAMIVVALAVPVELAARMEVGARTRLSIRIGWLFGLVSIQPKMGAGKRTKRKKAKIREKRRGRRMPSAAVIGRGFDLFGQILERVRVRQVVVDLTVGTGDPAETGELAGYASPLLALANALPRTRVTLTPDFSSPVLEGAGKGEIRFIPLTLVPPVVGFLLSPEVRRWLFARR